MSKILCECGHPEENHTAGRCNTKIPAKDVANHFVLCQCEEFKAARQDTGQAAASIVSGENED
jgi:hypothetical protein